MEVDGDLEVVAATESTGAVLNGGDLRIQSLCGYAGRHWLARGIQSLERGGCGLLGFNDGKWMGALAGFGLAARSRAAQNYSGDFFCSAYRRHYADAELSILAMSERRYCYDPNCVILEVDWDKDRSPVDAHDKALYRVKASGGLDGRVADPALRSLLS